MKFKSPNTITGYMFDLKLFKAYLNDDFETLTREIIERYKQHLQTKGLMATTINRKLVSIRRFIEYLSKSELSLQLDIEIISLDYQKIQALKNLLTYNDFKRLVDAALKNNDKRALAIFYCLYITGARVSEMLSLKVSDASKELIKIWGKGNKERFLQSNEILRTYLTEYIVERGHKNDSKLFLNIFADIAMDRMSVHKLIKKYARIAKIYTKKAHAHNFRHLCALRHKENGVQIDDIANLLGHEDINYTKIYTKNTLDTLLGHTKKLY